MASQNTNKKIAVAMSGGVDSAMTALLLKQQGFDIFGITMKIWNDSYEKWQSSGGRAGCFGPNEKKKKKSAQSVANRLGIPHFVIPLGEEYEKNVLNYFKKEYLQGRTPNPCVMCNRTIKFGALWSKALSLGLDFNCFATGHYARTFKDSLGRTHLLRAIDQQKDQTYFLSRLTQAQLTKTIFPLGDLLKKDVMELAKNNGFKDIAAREESQDFIEADDYSILFNKEDAVSGEIIDVNGNVLGYHKGLIHYTIGQREGLGIATGKKMYVKEILPQENKIVVAEHDAVLSSGCVVSDLNWIVEVPPSDATECIVKLRYKHKGVKAKIFIERTDLCRVVFDEPQFAVTPGQAAVFYIDDEMLGGGWIERSI